MKSMKLNMTTEQKAKSYDQVREKIALRFGSNVAEEIFSIFEESEDERIRKKLLEYFKSFTSETFFNGVPTSDAIAWLEKQAQKPDTNCLLSWSEMDEKMLQSLEGIVKDYWAKAEQEKNEIKIREASNVSYFLKTIQKSPLCWIKCSDGLPNKDGIYLVVTDGRHNDVYDMARYDSVEGWHKASEIIYWMPIPQLNNKDLCKTCKHYWQDFPLPLESVISHCEILDSKKGLSVNMDDEVSYPCLKCPFNSYIKK